MRHACLIVLTFVLGAATVQGHGGIYVAPNDAGGGSKDSGGTSAPPTNPGGSSTPSAGGSTQGRGTSARTSGGSRGGSPRATQGGGPVTVGSDPFTSDDGWEFWWEHNKDRFLDLKRRTTGSTNISGSAGALTDRGRPGTQHSSRRPSPDLVEAEVLPVLQELLATSDERDILDSAILALARATPVEDGGALLAAATRLLPHQELSVQSAAVLALGVGGSREAVPVLRALMTDSIEGRRLVGGGSVPSLLRAFGALSLGLLDDAASVASLCDVIEHTPDTERDVKSAAIVALGLMRGEGAEPAVRFLTGKLRDRKLDAVIASSIPTALGKLGDETAVPALLAVFRDRDTDDVVRQSAAIGLGQLASLAQTEVLDALTECIAEGRDAQTRHYCFMALGQIGARAAKSLQGGVSEQHEALVGLLGREVGKPSRADHRSWAALACALYGRESEAAAVQLVPRLSAAWENERDPSFRSALAVALGLLDATEMGPALLEDLQATRDASLRGYTALALGFLRHADAAETLLAQCRLKGVTPTYRLQVATALGLLGDAQAVQTLIATLQTSETLGVSSAVARALGLIGDAQAVDPLSVLARDAGAAGSVRGFACVALGILCEKTDLPWNAAIRAHNNYRATVPAIAEVLDIL